MEVKNRCVCYSLARLNDVEKKYHKKINYTHNWKKKRQIDFFSISTQLFVIFGEYVSHGKYLFTKEIIPLNKIYLHQKLKP